MTHPSHLPQEPRVPAGDAVSIPTGLLPAAKANGSRPEEALEQRGGQDFRPQRMLTVAEALRLALIGLMILLVGTGAGYAGSLLLPEQYGARMQLRYNLTQAEPNELLREDRTLITQLVVLRSRPVLEPVASANGLTAEELSENTSATIVESSEIIEVEIHDPSRERGQLMLQAIADRYIALANGPDQNPVRDYLESQLREVQERLRRPNVSSGEAGGLAQREAALLGQLDTLRLTGPPAQVLTPPYSLAEPVSPRPLFAAATGALTALLVAALVVLLVARRWMLRRARRHIALVSQGSNRTSEPQ